MSKGSGENLSCPTDVESSLRDRIAAVLDSHKTDPYSDWDCECGLTGIKWRDHVADAVIAALGLREESVGLLTRHVTEWHVHA